MSMPSSALEWMELPSTEMPGPHTCPASPTATPLPPLWAIVLPSPGAAPPMVTVSPWYAPMPVRPFPRGAPTASTPMKLP